MRSIAIIFAVFATMYTSALEPEKRFGRASALEMKPGDMLKIDFTSWGCYHFVHYLMTLKCGTSGEVHATLDDLHPGWDKKGENRVDGKPSRIATVTLDDATLARLDRSFEYCRAKEHMGCTTIDRLAITQTRNRVTIAREDLVDGSCHLTDDKNRIGFVEMFGNCPLAEPKAADLVGVYKPNDKTQKDIRERGHYPQREISIRLASDGTFTCTNIPDWWMEELGKASGGFVNQTGIWKLVAVNGFWAVGFEFSTSPRSNSPNTVVWLLGRKPPFTLYIELGGSIHDKAMEFTKQQ